MARTALISKVANTWCLKGKDKHQSLGCTTKSLHYENPFHQCSIPIVRSILPIRVYFLKFFWFSSLLNFEHWTLWPGLLLLLLLTTLLPPLPPMPNASAKFQPLYHQVLSQSLACGHLSGGAIRSHVHLQEYQGNWVFPSNGWRWSPPQSRPFKKKKVFKSEIPLNRKRGTNSWGGRCDWGMEEQ